MIAAPGAVHVLAGLPRDTDNAWVIAGNKADSHLTDPQHPSAGLDSVRVNDLRHP